MTISRDPALICPVLIGRTAALRSLHDLLVPVRGGSGRIALITGEAGIGKSRLTAELRIAARDDDRAPPPLIVQGNCFEPDRSLPYAPLVDLLHTFVSRSTPEEARDRFGLTAPDLAKLLPALGRLLPDLPPAPEIEPEREKRRLFQALAQFLTGLAATQPLLLIVEDIHWSDDASLEFLLYFARQIVGAPVLLVLTYRSDEVHPALAHFLAMLDRERLAAEFALARLSPTEVDAMLRAIFQGGAPVRRDFAAAVATLTEGNPFFIEEIVKSVATSDGQPEDARMPDAPQSADALQIPRSVQVAVQRRSERLSEAARNTLRLAAVAGRRFDFALLQALTGQDEATLLRAIKELIAAQLVVEESADRFAFRHALTRQAVYGELLARERRALHQTIAETMERLYAASNAPDAYSADLAYHFYEAGAWREALEYSRQVGERALALYAPRAAVDHFTRALGAAWQLDRSPPAALYRARGQAYETLGEFERARSDHETALASAHAGGDRQAEWQSLMDLGYLWAGRDYQRTGEFFRRAADLARTLDDPLVYARSLNRLANWHVNTGETAEALPIHHEALAIFEREADAPGRAETLDLLGMGTGIAGDVVRAIAHYGGAIDLFRTLGNTQVLSSSLASRAVYASPTFTETAPEMPAAREESARDAAEALALARKIGWSAGQSFAEFAATSSNAAYGNFGAALAHGHEAVRIATEIEHQQWIVCGRWALGHAYFLMRNADQAIAHLAAALPLARDLGSAWWIGNITGYLAQAYLLRRDIPAAEALLAATMPRDHAPRSSPERRMAWAWGETMLAKGDPAAALAIADGLIASAPGTPNPQAIPWLGKLRGEALTALHRLDEATRALEEAQRAATEQGARPLLWLIHRALGRVYQRSKMEEAAGRAFADARAVIASLGETIDDATLRAQFHTAALDTLPKERTRTPRQIETDRYGGLTAREREVAAQVARGTSNRAIAEVLFLSERTVATHITNILAKLDLTSRAQIATWAVSHGLAQPE
ncbi:MAG: helix-turn-helix transcriptional regulator [Thermomicrobiales bacterium]